MSGLIVWKQQPAAALLLTVSDCDLIPNLVPFVRIEVGNDTFLRILMDDDDDDDDDDIGFCLDKITK